MVEAGKGEFGGGAGAPKVGGALKDRNSDATLREGDGGCKAVWAGADDIGRTQGHIRCDAVRCGPASQI